jgi:hypothetical protein
VGICIPASLAGVLVAVVVADSASAAFGPVADNVDSLWIEASASLPLQILANFQSRSKELFEY